MLFVLFLGGNLQASARPLPQLDAANEARFRRGANYFVTNQYAQAIAELQGLEISSHPERVLYMLEECNRRTGHIEEAKATFHQLITRFPDSAWTHYLLAVASEDQQRFEESIEEYKKALDKDADIPNANFAIGYIYWRQQQPELARPWLQKQELQGCHGLANYYLGEIARSAHHAKEAEASYRQALRCDPSIANAHLRLGMLLADQTHYEAAIRELKDEIRLQPKSSAAHYRLAAVYERMGRTAEARAEYNTLRKIQRETDHGVDVTSDLSKTK